MIVGIIILVIAIILLVFSYVALAEDWTCDSNFIAFLAGVFLIFGIVIIDIFVDNEPTAMDVYQGKTTLQYTIVDSVKVDSTVVWKLDYIKTE